MRKINVLFLCTGNSCRSIMAEALLRARYGDRFVAYSAGADPRGVHPLTLQVLDEIGVDTNELRSKGVKEYLGKLRVHYLVIVCPQTEKNCPQIFPGMVERVFWTFDDPPAFAGTEGERLDKFREVRDRIAATIDSWVSELRTSGKAADGGGGEVS